MDNNIDYILLKRCTILTRDYESIGTTKEPQVSHKNIYFVWFLLIKTIRDLIVVGAS